MDVRRPDGCVYCTLTNNSRRTGANAANPLAPNPNGHIIRRRDAEAHTGATFEWDIFLIADAAADTEDAFGSPDGDARCRRPHRELRRLLSGVTGCEVTGVATTPDRRTLFCNIQHPGGGDPLLTTFPLPYDGVTIPRDATLVVRRKDGGIVGS